ncbi:serpentine type 7TM GPCR chemoreceptor srx domain-containing protein [Ditylenchus destructor]|uniref:Serpentine type 7TM GPCR chemoreceptor srx domain-containing protein n=1 Tax=Ditylenchus destructor TaxID=166010 RepID=A0AAD4NBJ3_9BILA|nr:serpentine type 7TM GPCR chemoreceptor srx domain-containing protein [Ditylenchus destructor]
MDAEFPIESAPKHHALLGLLLFTLTVFNMTVYGFVLVSVKEISKKQSTFILLFSHGMADMGVMAQLVWISIEIITYSRVPVPWYLDNVLLKTFFKASNYHFIVIAINRAHCILFPMSYATIWKQKVFMAACILCWACGLTEALCYTYAVKVDPRAFIIHNLERMTFSRLRWDVEGADFLNKAEMYYYLCIVILAIIIYLLVLIKLLLAK